MDYLSERLRILDTKFQMLINVNAAMLTITALLLRQSKELTDQLPSSNLFDKIAAYAPVLKPGFSHFIYQALTLASIVLVLFSLFNIRQILRGFRRVIWGDLNFKDNTGEENKEQNIDFLIISVTRRTNMFRVTAVVTRWLFWLFVFLLLSYGIIGLAGMARSGSTDQTTTEWHWTH
jgi:hypothetical protein